MFQHGLRTCYKQNFLGSATKMSYEQENLFHVFVVEIWKLSCLFFPNLKKRNDVGDTYPNTGVNSSFFSFQTSLSQHKDTYNSLLTIGLWGHFGEGKTVEGGEFVFSQQNFLVN